MHTTEKPLERSLVLPNDVNEVPQLASFIEGVCEELGVDMVTTMQLNLALEEAVVNVMTYAYPAGTKGYADIRVEADDKRMTIVISDTGIPFDPTAKADVDTTLSVEQRGIGGLGIHLVKTIMDDVSYQRVDGQNVLTLRKNL